MFQGCPKDVLRVYLSIFRGCFKDNSRELFKRVLGVSSVF